MTALNVLIGTAVVVIFLAATTARCRWLVRNERWLLAEERPEDER